MMRWKTTFLAPVAGVFALAGCAVKPQTAMIATAVSIQETSTFRLTEEMLEEARRASEATSTELESFSLIAGDLSKENLEAVSKNLRSGDEQGLLDFVQIVRRVADAAWDVDVREFAVAVARLRDEFSVLVIQVLTTAELRELDEALALMQKSPEPPEAQQPASKPSVPAVVQRVLVILQRLEKGTQRRLATKRRLQVWLETQVTKHAFSPSVSVTIDLANPDDKPIVVSEVAHIAMSGIDPRGFTMRSRNCNDAITACRVIFGYDLTEKDVAKLKALLGEQYKEELKFTKQLRSYLDSIEVNVDLMVDGRETQLSMPGRMMKLE